MQGPSTHAELARRDAVCNTAPTSPLSHPPLPVCSVSDVGACRAGLLHLAPEKHVVQGGRLRCPLVFSACEALCRLLGRQAIAACTRRKAAAASGQSDGSAHPALSCFACKREAWAKHASQRWWCEHDEQGARAVVRFPRCLRATPAYCIMMGANTFDAADSGVDREQEYTSTCTHVPCMHMRAHACWHACKCACRHIYEITGQFNRGPRPR